MLILWSLIAHDSLDNNSSNKLRICYKRIASLSNVVKKYWYEGCNELCHIRICWEKPSVGQHKLNRNASWKNMDGGIGFVIRDDTGNCVLSRCRYLGNRPIVHSQAASLRDGWKAAL